jgi:hypothetical protein
MMLESRFWESVAERAAKTFCQSLLSFLTVGGFMSVNGVPWLEAAGAALMASLLSVLTSIASAGTGGDQGPSWGGIERIENRPLPGRGDGVDEDIVPERGDG